MWSVTLTILKDCAEPFFVLFNNQVSIVNGANQEYLDNTAVSFNRIPFIFCPRNILD